MKARFEALQVVGARTTHAVKGSEKGVMERFGSRVFNRQVMEQRLPKAVYQNVISAMQGRGKIQPEHADTIAMAMKDWAVELGATHYTHWFQPLTGAAAEKHDAFIDWKTTDTVIEKFGGNQLIQGEPDASSFPSGGLRSTYEARGYTGWDPSSYAFVWKGGDGMMLCIPSVFFSWTGDVLDKKIPLLRADQKINDACMRLLALTGTDANSVFSTLGWEQEYFIVDRALRNLRPDLLLLGRTVYGDIGPKGQELDDHYFGAIKDRILSFMKDFENEAMELGIAVKTRHNEVAPSQYEIAPVFEKASLSVDHNILMMELMRHVAVQHNLVCLFHEKPFAGVNGSGKHNNWSLATDTGFNLLDPTDTPESSLQFLIMITAVLHAVYENSDLLRASVGSAANDYRLGANEAPPAIISVYLGDALESLFNDIESKGSHTSSEKVKYDLGIPVIPHLSKDNTDRNRTSPFAFTGNKFEFRAVGASASCALPITMLNAIVSHSLNKIVDDIEANLNGTNPHSKGVPTRKALAEAAMPVLKKYLKHSKSIRFTGDNYSDAWEKEAKKRGLGNFHKSTHAFAALKSAKACMVFQGILTKQELEARYEISMELYAKNSNIEAKLMVDLFRTQILPAAIDCQKAVAESLQALSAVQKGGGVQQRAVLKELSNAIEEAIKAVDGVEGARASAMAKHGAACALAFSDVVSLKNSIARKAVDALECIVDDRRWPLPKYRELLFLV